MWLRSILMLCGGPKAHEVLPETRLHWPINEYRQRRAGEGIDELLDGCAFEA